MATIRSTSSSSYLPQQAKKSTYFEYMDPFLNGNYLIYFFSALLNTASKRSTYFEYMDPFLNGNYLSYFFFSSFTLLPICVLSWWNRYLRLYCLPMIHTRYWVIPLYLPANPDRDQQQQTWSLPHHPGFIKLWDPWKKKKESGPIKISDIIEIWKFNKHEDHFFCENLPLHQLPVSCCLDSVHRYPERKGSNLPPTIIATNFHFVYAVIRYMNQTSNTTNNQQINRSTDQQHLILSSVHMYPEEKVH